MNYKFRKKLNEDITNNSFEEKVAEVKQQLQNGARPKDVFDYVSYFYNGIAKVRLGDKGDKWNFIDRNGNFLSDLWFDFVSDFFNEGFAKVYLNGKYNFIDRKGNLLREDLWFDFVGVFNEGFAAVKLNGKYNYITTDGNILSDLWFDKFYRMLRFSNGFAIVQLKNRGWNYLDTDGNILREDLWFDKAWNFHNGFAKVYLNGKRNLINTDGELLREDLWFDKVSDFNDGFALVNLNGQIYNIDTKGNLYDLYGNPIENVNESKRRVVRLTESQLRKTIKKVVTQYLNESKRR